MGTVVPVRSVDPERRHSPRALRPTLVARAASALLSKPAAEQYCSAENPRVQQFCTSNSGTKRQLRCRPRLFGFAGSRISYGKYGVRGMKHFDATGTALEPSSFPSRLSDVQPPKGASDFEERMASLKRCPDAKRDSFGKL